MKKQKRWRRKRCLIVLIVNTAVNVAVEGGRTIKAAQDNDDIMPAAVDIKDERAE